MAENKAVHTRGLTFRYGDRMACNDLSFEVEAGSVHAFLGPNGSGKSTLFKILSTAYPLQDGDVSILGLDLRRDAAAIRPRVGVVFQSPALDAKLTVRENMIYGGYLYAMRGAALRSRVDEMLRHTGLSDRQSDRVSDLSGGLRRRVELAKGLLPRPALLLLDEPSTGLDPGARRDLWQFLRSLEGVTVLFSTHLMDEAEHADRVTIMSEGLVVAEGLPEDLVRDIGGEVLELTCADPEALAPRIADRFDVQPLVLEHSLRIQRERVHLLVGDLMDAFGDAIGRLSLSPPSLEDVFIQATGHRFWADQEEGQ